MWNSNGQVSVTVALIAAGGTIFTALAGAWFTSATQVAVIEEREQNHYTEVKALVSEQGDTIDEIDRKLDVLLMRATEE